MLGCTRSVWEAVQTWQIQPKGPRAADPASVYKAGEWVRAVEAYDRVQQRELQHLFHSFLAALITYFDCVRAGRARHTVGWHQEEQAHLFCTLREQRAIVDSHISQMRRLIQDVKLKGLPGGEAHRIDNYINMIGVGFERLCAIKEYRTPRAFRAFARVYILLVGAMYGPDYIMLARSDDGDESNIDAESGHLLRGATGWQPGLLGWVRLALGGSTHSRGEPEPLRSLWGCVVPPSARVKACPKTQLRRPGPTSSSLWSTRA